MAKENASEIELFEIRDLRVKEKYFIDDKFLNGYAAIVGIHAVGVYNCLCRHANKSQRAWPAINNIAEILGIGRTSVVEAIKKLEEYNIIRKDRPGKKMTNRYALLNKSIWNPLEVKSAIRTSLGEVKSATRTSLGDEGSPPHGLRKSATRTSQVRHADFHSKDTQSKDTQERYCAPPSADAPISEWSNSDLTGYLAKMANDPQPAIRLIMLFWGYRNVGIELKGGGGIKIGNKKTAEILIRRSIRIANDLVSAFSFEQIEDMMMIYSQYADFDWQLSNILKDIVSPKEKVVEKLKSISQINGKNKNSRN